MQEKRNPQTEAMKLLLRMVQQARVPHRLPKRPTEVEQRMADAAVDMLVLIQMLPYILCDVREELEAIGQYRHIVKRRLLQAEGIVFVVAEPAYQIFARFNPETAKGFLDRVDRLYQRMKDDHRQHSVEVAVSFLDTACRLIEKLNHQIERTYYFDHADPLYKIPRLLDCIPGQRHDMTTQIVEALQTVKCAEPNKPAEK